MTKVAGGHQKSSYKRSSVINTGEEKSNTEADALRFEDLNCPCFQNATEVIAADSHTFCDRHNAIHCFYTWMTWILHSLSSLNLFKSWQFMLYYSTLLVLIIRLKSFLHEINWNFKKTQARPAVFKATEIFPTVKFTNKLQIQRRNAEDQTFLCPYPEVFRWVQSRLRSISHILHAR